MNYLNLNLIPNKITNNEISEQDALNLLCEFVQENFPIFGLHKYDSDFRSEVILMLLEKGNRIFDLYDEKLGSFFSYFYRYVQGLKLNLLKRNTINQINEAIAFEHSKENYYEKISKNTIINTSYNLFENDNYIESVLSDENIKTNKEILKILKMHPRGYEKFLLVLSLKSSYQLTDKYIKIISKTCKISEEKLLNLIEYLNSKIEIKRKRQAILEEKRNKAYFNQKKYEKRLQQFSDEADKFNQFEKKEILERYKKTTATFERINNQIFKKTSYLMTTNKDISNALGICERQVNYYVKEIKKMTNNYKTDYEE